MKDQKHIPEIFCDKLNHRSIRCRAYGNDLIFPWRRPTLLRDEVLPRMQNARLGNPVLQDVRMHHYLKHGSPYFVLRNYTEWNACTQ